MNQRGFTLLEVLVATLIMGVAVVGLLSNLSASLRNAGRLTDYDRARMMAKRAMDDLLTQPDLPKLAVIEGQWDPAIVGVEGGWRAQIIPFERPPGAGPGTPALDRVELEVWWMQADQRRTFALEAFRPTVLRPQDLALEVGPP